MIAGIIVVKRCRTIVLLQLNLLAMVGPQPVINIVLYKDDNKDKDGLENS